MTDPDRPTAHSDHTSLTTAALPVVGRMDLPRFEDAEAVKAQFSTVFRPKVRPLKIGTFEDLLAAGAPPEATKLALELYTSSRQYYRAFRIRRRRWDMHGKPVGEVTYANQLYADEQLALLNRIEGK